MKYLFANWKMYLNAEESCRLARSLQETKFDTQKTTVCVFPTMIVLSEVKKMLKQRSIQVGAQNISWASQGAYTGAVSAFLCKEAGCQYALVGHSERRYIFNETNDDVNKKIAACFDTGLIPILCIGETREDMDEGKREYRLKKQLLSALEGLSIPADSGIMIAYEPVWAISQGGAGIPCSPEEAESVHQWIKIEMRQYTDFEIPVLYGGSVDSSNVLSYLHCHSIDGVLVGSASTNIDSLTSLITATDTCSQVR